ncbi:MAG: AsmA-like C-terminal region-containing protein [Saprospiraceae bacterium]|nr:AsmA-like C-terminal region-containing protein [Saprospiraceae bacterium]
MAAKKSSSKKKKKRSQKTKKKNNLKMYIKAFLGLIILLVFSLISIAAIFEKQIAELVIISLNQQLKTELIVSDASLSLIWKFPQAGVYLHNVRIDGVGDHEEKLLDVGSISLKCSTIGLLTGKYNFTAISIKNGSLFVYKDKNGGVNYNIFKSTNEEKTENSDLNLTISNAKLTNLKIHYVDEYVAHDMKIIAKSAFFEGDFIINNELNQNKHTMTSYAELYSEYIKIGETTYFKTTDFAYDGAIDLDLDRKLYALEQIKLYLQGNEFKVDGTIETVSKGIEYNLVFESKQAFLGSMMQLIPDQFTSPLGQLESNGNLTFNARINGLSSAESTAIIEVNFGLKNGRLTHPRLTGAMKDVNFDVHFTNGNGIDDKTAKLKLIDFRASLNNEPINLSWDITGLKNPLISLSIDGNIPIDAIHNFFGINVTEGNGCLEVARLTLNGRLLDMTTMHGIPKVKLDGLINFKEVYLLVNDIETNIPSGSLALENNIFNVSDIIIQTEASDLELNGAFHNVLPVLLSDSLNSKKAKLTFQASLNASKIDVDELLAIGSRHSAEEIEAAAVTDKDSLTKETYEIREYRTSFLKGTFNTNIKSLTYGKITGENFNGEIEFDNSVMSLKGVEVNAMEGLFELNSKIHFEKEPRVELFLDCHDIDIQEFLLQLNNFEQEVITYKNLRGRLESLIKVNLFLDSLGNFKHDDLFVVADVTIKDGALNNLKILEGFSKYVNIRDLQSVVFSELKNQFKIEHGKFYMPAMFIQSSALNLLIGGEYSFNHDLDFKIKINAGQILANKFKKYNPSKKTIKAKKNGLFNIYAHIFGNLYNKFEYKLGPRNSKKYLEDQLDQNLPILANTLRMEFKKNTGENDPLIEELKQPVEWEDIPEYEGVEGEDEFLEGF